MGLRTCESRADGRAGGSGGRAPGLGKINTFLLGPKTCSGAGGSGDPTPGFGKINTPLVGA